MSEKSNSGLSPQEILAATVNLNVDPLSPGEMCSNSIVDATHKLSGRLQNVNRAIISSQTLLLDTRLEQLPETLQSTSNLHQLEAVSAPVWLSTYSKKEPHFGLVTFERQDSPYISVGAAIKDPTNEKGWLLYEKLRFENPKKTNIEGSACDSAWIVAPGDSYDLTIDPASDHQLSKDVDVRELIGIKDLGDDQIEDIRPVDILEAVYTIASSHDTLPYEDEACQTIINLMDLESIAEEIHSHLFDLQAQEAEALEQKILENQKHMNLKSEKMFDEIADLGRFETLNSRLWDRFFEEAVNVIPEHLYAHIGASAILGQTVVNNGRAHKVHREELMAEVTFNPEDRSIALRALLRHVQPNSPSTKPAELLEIIAPYGSRETQVTSDSKYIEAVQKRLSTNEQTSDKAVEFNESYLMERARSYIETPQIKLKRERSFEEQVADFAELAQFDDLYLAADTDALSAMDFKRAFQLGGPTILVPNLMPSTMGLLLDMLSSTEPDHLVNVVNAAITVKNRAGGDYPQFSSESITSRERLDVLTKVLKSVSITEKKIINIGHLSLEHLLDNTTRNRDWLIKTRNLSGTIDAPGLKVLQGAHGCNELTVLRCVNAFERATTPQSCVVVHASNSAFAGATLATNCTVYNAKKTTFEYGAEKSRVLFSADRSPFMARYKGDFLASEIPKLEDLGNQVAVGTNVRVVEPDERHLTDRRHATIFDSQRFRLLGWGNKWRNRPINWLLNKRGTKTYSMTENKKWIDVPIWTYDDGITLGPWRDRFHQAPPQTDYPALYEYVQRQQSLAKERQKY